MPEIITWAEFEKVELRIATITGAEPFREARKPAFILTLDLGNGDIRKSSAQITDLYKPEDLIGKQVMCVANFPKKQIGPIMSEVLVTGFHRADGAVVLAVPDKPVGNGAKLA